MVLTSDIATVLDVSSAITSVVAGFLVLKQVFDVGFY